jgi:hypothetical protein
MLKAFISGWVYSLLHPVEQVLVRADVTFQQKHNEVLHNKKFQINLKTGLSYHHSSISLHVANRLPS